jgi:hypothetical protein
MWAHDQMSFSAYYADALCMKIFIEKCSTHIKSSPPPPSLIPSTPPPFLSLLRIQNNILLGYRAGCYQINMASLNKKCFKRSAIMHLPSGAPAWPSGRAAFPLVAGWRQTMPHCHWWSLLWGGGSDCLSVRHSNKLAFMLIAAKPRSTLARFSFIPA